MDEVLLIDKPAGMTSFGVVARVRRKLTEELRRHSSTAAPKRLKVGHTGTLDPFATGLMILVTGKKCREAGAFSKLDKWYEAEILLGQQSSTGDPEGELTMVSDVQPTIEQIRTVLEKFTGEIEQTPPKFSAIKIDGQRAYKLARAGKEVDIPARKVQIFTLELVTYTYPSLKIRAHVSSGTYIRTLAEDIGRELGVGAYCRALRRTKIADFDVRDARTLESLGIFS